MEFLTIHTLNGLLFLGLIVFLGLLLQGLYQGKLSFSKAFAKHQDFLPLDFTHYVATISENNDYYCILNSSQPQLLAKYNSNPGELKLARSYRIGRNLTILVIENNYTEFLLAKTSEISFIEAREK